MVQPNRALLLAVMIVLVAVSAGAEIVQSPADYSTPFGTTTYRLGLTFDQTHYTNGTTSSTFAFAPAFRKFFHPDFSFGAELYADWTSHARQSFSRQAAMGSFQWVAPGWNFVRPFVDGGAGVSHFGVSDLYGRFAGVGFAGKAAVGAYVFMTETVALSPQLIYNYDSRAELYNIRYPGVNELAFFMGIEVFFRQ